MRPAEYDPVELFLGVIWKIYVPVQMFLTYVCEGTVAVYHGCRYVSWDEYVQNAGKREYAVTVQYWRVDPQHGVCYNSAIECTFCP